MWSYAARVEGDLPLASAEAVFGHMLCYSRLQVTPSTVHGRDLGRGNIAADACSWLTGSNAVEGHLIPCLSANGSGLDWAWLVLGGFSQAR